MTLFRDVPTLAVDYCGIDVYGVTRRLVAFLVGDLGTARWRWLPSEPGRQVAGEPCPLLVMESRCG